MALPGFEHKGYPWQGPKRDMMGVFRFTGWNIDLGEVKPCSHCGEEHEDGNSLQGKPDIRVMEQLFRLRDELSPLGWDITADMLNVEATWEDGFMCDGAMAFLHIFVNGCDVGCDTLPTGYGLRICADELRGNLEEDRNEVGQVKASECLEELVKRLPEHIDRLIRHFKAYPAYKRESH